MIEQTEVNISPENPFTIKKLFTRALQFSSLLVLGFYLNGCGVPDSYKYEKTLGSQGKKEGEFYGAKTLKVIQGSQPTLAVLENLNNRVQIIDPDGNPVKMIAHHPANKMLKLINPTAVAIHPKTDDIAISDQKLNKIFVYSKIGSLKTTIRDVLNPKSLAWNEEGQIYVVFLKKHLVEVYETTALGGKMVKTIGGAGKAVLKGPIAIETTKNAIYILEEAARRLVKWDHSGKVIWQVKGKGDYDEFIGPKGLAVDKDDNVYVADMGEIPCVKFDKDGNFLSKIGTFGKEKGQIYSPAGIAADNSGNVYVSDKYLNHIVVFKPEQQ